MHEHDPHQPNNDHHDANPGPDPQDTWEPNFVLDQPAWVGRLPMRLRPWVGAWVNPRDTYHHVAAHVPTTTLLVASALAGGIQAVAQAAAMGLGKDIPLAQLVPTCLTVGLVLGGCQFLLLSWLFAVTGRWLGGQGTPATLKPAVGWSAAMSLVTGCIWLPRIALFGEQLFNGELNQETLQQMPPAMQAGMTLWMLLETAAGLWMFVCTLKMLGQAHGFSPWRALGSILTALGVILAPLILGMAFAGLFQ